MQDTSLMVDMSQDTVFESARELCIIIADLNYDAQNTLVKPEDFLRPNFKLVCDLLSWFACIVEPDKLKSDEVCAKNMMDASEKDRLAFLINMGKLFSSQLGVRLNLVRLYRADLSCCAELMKLARLIYRAAELEAKSVGKRPNDGVSNDQSYEKEIRQASGKKLETLSNLLALLGSSNADERDVNSSSIISSQHGFVIEMSELTRNLDRLIILEESELKRERLSVMDRRLEMREVGKILRDSHDKFIGRSKELAQLSDGLERDLILLDEKLRRKELELDETRERFNDSLISQSAQYLKRHDKLKLKYEQVYDEFVSKLRNYMYLRDCVYHQRQFSNQELEPENEELEDPEGPARLLESLEGPALGRSAADSLFTGASKPMSASLTAAGGASILGDSTEARLRATGIAGATGKRETLDRAAEANEFNGLELEGLLNEFMLDESLATTETREPDADGLLEDLEGEEEESQSDETGDELEDQR